MINPHPHVRCSFSANQMLFPNPQSSLLDYLRSSFASELKDDFSLYFANLQVILPSAHSSIAAILQFCGLLMLQLLLPIIVPDFACKCSVNLSVSPIA